MKVNINGHGHMTKMATMAINSKNFYKSYSSEPEDPVNGALQSLYNHDPWMTLTYFMARSAEVTYPRSQVSIYCHFTGPLFLWFSFLFEGEKITIISR